MRRFIEFIGSRRFAVIILAATLAVILLSNLLPNIALMKPGEAMALRRERPLLYAAASYLHLSVIAGSPFFLILPVFIFTSVAVCTVNRIRGRRPETARPAYERGKYLARTPAGMEVLEGLLISKGWAVERVDGAGVAGFKGGKGFWGSATFHIGLNVVIIGIALSLITRFNRSVILTDGYGVELPEAFLQGKPKDFPLTGALMEGFKAVYVEGFPVDYSMDLTVWKRVGMEKKEVKVNRPASFLGYQFVPVRYGFSPRFLLKDKGKGIILMDTYVNLVVMTADQTDTFNIPQEGMKITAQFFPDFYAEGKLPKSRSREAKNPVFFVEVAKGDEIIGRGFLPMGKEVAFAGYSLEFRDLAMWVMFDVSRDFGIPVITFGFIFIVAGLIIRLVWNEKSVWISLRDGGVEIGGRARYFPAIFEEELKGLAEEIRRI